MNVVKLGDLLDEQELAKAIEGGFVRRQVHPEWPYAILNYTERCTYERAWTNITRTCRGLIIIDRTGEVIARPWAKFFNYGEHPEGSLDLLAPAEVTNKMDGSLGIMYRAGDGWSIATRGSFASEQAVHATTVLREHYPDFTPPDGMTVLFEIVYPANRIVVDYGSTDDLVLLGAVDIATGEAVGPDRVSLWPGPVTETMSAATLAEALALPPRPGCEGVVVRMPGPVMIKLKQDDYQALHRILTGTNARSVWEFMAVNACKHLIEQPKHWGTRLGLDPDRAQKLLAVGPDWLDKLTEKVPDEFYGWLKDTIAGIGNGVGMLRVQLGAEMNVRQGMSRPRFAESVKGHPHMGALFLLYDRRDIESYLWKAMYPAADKPWGMRSEDVA